ncbi:MAG: TonB-dependent receptor plug domain-containing protein, partial [Bryobacter sp.]|nr:TonB-dependent receptor plug domain-containing protein [Bryobacter sp.]
MLVEGVSNSVLVTAESSAMTLDQTAKAVSLIESSEVTERNEYMLAEILRNTPGVQVRQQGGPGQFTQMRIRGLRPDAVAVLIDGLRFRDPSTTQG